MKRCLYVLHEEKSFLISIFRISGKITHSYLAPSAMQAGDTVVALDRFSALGTFSMTITFDPMMSHCLGRFFTLDISGYTGGWRSLYAPLVHRVLAN